MLVVVLVLWCRVAHCFKFVYWNRAPPRAERNLLVYNIVGYIEGIVDRTNHHDQF